MSIEELNIFVTVAQTLNFTQAAEKLHFSQPTLSRHISELERELGVTILASNMMEEYSNLEHLHLAELDTLSSSSHLLAAWDQASANPCLPQFVDELHRMRKSRG